MGADRLFDIEGLNSYAFVLVSPHARVMVATLPKHALLKCSCGWRLESYNGWLATVADVEHFTDRAVYHIESHTRRKERHAS